MIASMRNYLHHDLPREEGKFHGSSLQSLTPVMGKQSSETLQVGTGIPVTTPSLPYPDNGLVCTSACAFQGVIGDH